MALDRPTKTLGHPRRRVQIAVDEDQHELLTPVPHDLVGLPHQSGAQGPVLPGLGLRRRQAKKNNNTYWWGCSGYPQCKRTYRDQDGAPAAWPEKQEVSS